ATRRFSTADKYSRVYPTSDASRSCVRPDSSRKERRFTAKTSLVRMRITSSGLHYVHQTSHCQPLVTGEVNFNAHARPECHMKTEYSGVSIHKTLVTWCTMFLLSS